METPFDPSQVLPQPTPLPYAASTRVLGTAIRCYTLADRDALPMEWREEGSTVVFVDDQWGTAPVPPAPEGGWAGDPVPVAEREEPLPLPVPDDRPPRPFPPGAYFRLQNGRTNECWVPFGGGGDFTYSINGTGVTVGGAPAGTVFGTFDGDGNRLSEVPGREVLDAIFRTPFAVSCGLSLSGENVGGNQGGSFGLIAFGLQYIFEKGTLLEITATGAASVTAGEITARRLSLDGAVFAPPAPLVGFAAPAITGRLTGATYGAAVDYTRNAGGGGTASASRTVTPYGLTYLGVVNTLLPSEATMKALTDNLWGPATREWDFFSTNQRAAYAEPVALGGLSQITDATGADIYYDRNASEATNAFVRYYMVYELADGTPEAYYLYVKKSVAGNGTPFTYKFVR